MDNLSWYWPFGSYRCRFTSLSSLLIHSSVWAWHPIHQARSVPARSCSCVGSGYTSFLGSYNHSWSYVCSMLPWSHGASSHALCGCSSSPIAYYAGATSVERACSTARPSVTWCCHCCLRPRLCDGASGGLCPWVCIRSAYEYYRTNILLNTLVSITPVGFVEDWIPRDSNLFVLLLILGESILPSVCPIFFPCPPSICLSLLFLFIQSLLVGYCWSSTFVYPERKLMYIE